MIFDRQRISWHEVQNVEAGYDRLAELVSAARAVGVPTVTVLVPSVGASRVYKEELAVRDVTFGVRVEDFCVWLVDMWEVYGDDRCLTDAVMRSVLCARALEASPELRATPGMVKLMAGMVEECLPHLLSDAALGVSCSKNERALLECVARYGRMLDERGLVEPCEAACRIAPAVAGERVFLAGFDEDELTPTHLSALGTSGANAIRNLREQAPRASGDRSYELTCLLNSLASKGPRGRVNPKGALRLAIASGVTCENRLIADELCRIAQGGGIDEIVVVSPQPEKLFYAISADLNKNGLGTALRCSKPLAESAVGRLVARVAAAFLDESPFDKKAATELLMSDLTEAGYLHTFRFDEAARNDRLIEADKLHAVLGRHLKDSWLEVVDLLAEGRLGDALNKMHSIVEGVLGLPEGYRAEQLAAVQTMGEYAALAEAERVPLEVIIATVKDCHYRVELDAPAADTRSCVRAVFMSLEDAAALRPGSCDALVVTRMTAEDYPVRDQLTSHHALLAKTGVRLPHNPLARVRRVFYDALASARHVVVLERALYDGDADPRTSAAMFDEVVECYRVPGEKPNRDAKNYGACNSLVDAGCITVLDESRFVYAVAGCDRQPTCCEEPVPPTGVLSDDAAEYALLPKTSGGCEGLKVIPATDVEMYLQCPYKWFLERRLGLDTPDEELGSREYGTFVHMALERFYAFLQADGHARVNGGNVGRAREALAESFEEVVREQYSMKPRSGRFVPHTAFEQERFTTCKHALTKYVEQEARFLPGFEPVHLEYSFGSEVPVRYADVLVSGKIDRIDVDAQGRAVVIDYKSGQVKKDDFADLAKTEEGTALPFRVQVFIYAQIARRELGLNVVGVAYVNPVGREVCAVFDAGCLTNSDFLADAADCMALPNREHEGDVEGFRSFADALDCIEEEIAQRIPGLEAGETAPCSSKPKSTCSYCCAALCDGKVG